MSVDDLLKVIGTETERQEFLRLARQYQSARQAREHGSRAASAESAQPDSALFDEVAQRVRKYFRAIRHPMPTEAELQRMIAEYFGKP